MAKAFDDLWNTFAPQVLRGGGTVDVTSEAPIYSAVARLDAHSAERLRRSIEPLHDVLADHYIYPASDLHLTLLYVSPYVEGADEEETTNRVAAAQQAFAEIVPATPAPVFTISGLGVFPTTVFAQLVPTYDTDFEAVRRQLSRALHARGLDGAAAADFEQDNRWDLCFVNVARFTRPAAADVVSAVAPMRALPLGSATFASVQLVRTDKFLSRTGTEILGEFAFAPRRGSC